MTILSRLKIPVALARKPVHKMNTSYCCSILFKCLDKAIYYGFDIKLIILESKYIIYYNQKKVISIIKIKNRLILHNYNAYCRLQVSYFCKNIL